MNKRGQTTLFIVLGIIIVVIAVILISVYKPELISPTLNEGQLQPIKNYIEDCVKDKLNSDLESLRIHAGKFSFLEQPYSKDVGGGKYLNYLVYNKDNKASIKQGIENQISSNIKDYLKGCSLEHFRGQFDIDNKVNEIDVETNIGDHTVLVDVYYPIIVRKNGIELTLDEFSIQVESDFGLVYDVILKIVDEDLNNGFKIADDLTGARFGNILVSYDVLSGNDFVVTVGTQKEANNGIRRVEFLVRR